MSKTTARLVRLTLVLGIALAILLAGWKVAPTAFSLPTFAFCLAAAAFGALLGPILFARFFGGPERAARRAAGEGPEHGDKVKDFISSVHESRDPAEMLGLLDELLTRRVRVSGYQLLTVEDSSRKFAVLQQHPATAPAGPPLSHDSALVAYFRVNGADHLSALAQGGNGSAQHEKEARASLTAAGAQFCFPFMVASEPFGLLLVRERSDGKRYTAADIQLLDTLSRNLSLALNQIRLKNQILQAQEAELLGRMSRGMAHDLNNLVTPVQTLMQLMGEGIPIDALKDELLPLATRSIETLREYIREALFFSENARGDFKLGRLDMVLGEAVGIMTARCEQKGIAVDLDSRLEALVEMDKSLIKRTLVNVLGNAIDASAAGMQIRVELTALEKTEPERDWYRIRIVDHGEGIDPEDLRRVFTPYFTTKTRGDEQRGFGLGLSICRKVVQIHGGTLKITSKPKSGTTVVIDLPDQQLKKPSPHLAPVP